jgi:hypothetical protein
MPISGVMAIVSVIQMRICCRGHLRDGREAARHFILLAGQYFNFGLVSAVKNVLKLLSKQVLYAKAERIKKTINLLPS